MPRWVRIKWPSLEVSARMKLLEDRAPELCKAFVQCLPLRGISWHAVISGENVGFPVPLVWTRVDNPSPRVRGGVFLYANGQLVVIPYGKTTEPGLVNVFGEIADPDLERLAQAGRSVAASLRSGLGHPIFVEITLESGLQ